MWIHSDLSIFHSTLSGTPFYFTNSFDLLVENFKYRVLAFLCVACILKICFLLIVWCVHSGASIVRREENGRG